ncbi:MAG: hypothetical protein LBP32_00795 [Spirochaetaceae bacterium]|jgi:hypothetical protein|nr:hypothetical protein [Spirochaetaceae bacterium]
MKKRLVSTFVIRAAFILLVLAGCDDPVNSGNDNWLADTANPLIGTWAYGSGNSAREAAFKTDATVVTVNPNDKTSTTLPYLIRDNFFVVSSTSSPYYTKYFFEVIDNNTLKVVQDGRSTTIYTRKGAENPDAGRAITLSNGLEGFWRRDNLKFGTTEAAMFMYDWYTFRKDGTYHVYHYMNKQKDYVDRGDFSYFIDNGNRLVSLSNGYTVTVYHNFTKTGGDAFSWKTSADGEGLGFEKFDGKTFWHPGTDGGGGEHHGM